MCWLVPGLFYTTVVCLHVIGTKCGLVEEEGKAGSGLVVHAGKERGEVRERGKGKKEREEDNVSREISEIQLQHKPGQGIKKVI